MTTSSKNTNDIFKFSMNQLFSNETGKTSSANFIGIMVSFIIMVMFIVVTIFYFFNVEQSSTILALIDKMISLFGISAGLLGVKSISTAFDRNNKSVVAIGHEEALKREENDKRRKRDEEETSCIEETSEEDTTE